MIRSWNGCVWRIIILTGVFDVDVLRFTNPSSPTKVEQGEIVNGILSKLWVERYREAGEFTFEAYVSSGLKDVLPIGSFVSHVDTSELMIVENHEISHDINEQEPRLTISGRSFESYLDNRIVGSNQEYPTSGGIIEYVLSSANIHDQVVTMINEHISATELIDGDDAIPYVEAITDITVNTPAEDRIIKRGGLYTRVLELLELEDFGIKTLRPGPWTPLGVPSTHTTLMVHKGQSLVNEVVFSYDTGEIESADYLWSDKKLKNYALVSGRWVETLVGSSPPGYGRRVMLVDATDIDNHHASAPTGAERTAIVSAMQARGAAELASQRNIALVKANSVKNAVDATYRSAFNVGDIISVTGGYSEREPKRISEYVEIEDSNGEIGYPTLTSL